ncbi:hypothetical protein [Vibrio vulnificus]|uniref:hypothetical protein n=1 Tax=Vibrio vulnificus TaxID=672 RepID=UPI001A25B480|nr:hypothetical protein [Vibrio vulnificus]MCA3894910.1 hypothetical protein [Vibrio vulnificus]HAS8375689.1 hypothetical protein [Vibrio vulnificus]
MSKVLLSSPYDLNLIKEWAETLQNILGHHGINEVARNTILNIVARSLGYTEWAHLVQYNKSRVWFTDINAEINYLINKILANLSTVYGIDIQRNSNLHNDVIFHLRNGGLATTPSIDEPNTERSMQMLLVPGNRENYYKIIPFVDELDLVMRLESFSQNSLLFGHTVKANGPLPLAKNKVRFPPSYPLHKTLHDLLPSGYAFVAHSKYQYAGFDYVLDADLDIPENVIMAKLLEVMFVNPQAIVYEFKKTKNNHIKITNVTEHIETSLKINVRPNSQIYLPLIEMFQIEGKQTLYMDFEHYTLPLGKRPQSLSGTTYLERCDNVIKERFGS